MEFECLADTNIFLEKKKYSMQIVNKEGDWCLEKPKMKIRGIEVVRSSTPQCVRDKLKTALEMIFKTENNDKLIEFIEEFKKEFYKLPYEAVAFPRGVNFSDYTLQSKSLPIAVRAAFVYNKALVDMKLDNKYISVGDGGKSKFCYIKEPNAYRSDVIGILDKMPEEMKGTFKIDYDTQFKKAFLNPLEKIFECIGWQLEKSHSLDDIFG
jgi:DNA polymerase elongation subunit (family B)